jgi:hypothetical protein
MILKFVAGTALALMLSACSSLPRLAGGEAKPAAPAGPAVANKRQYYDMRLARYYYFDTTTGRYYWESGEPRFP